MNDESLKAQILSFLQTNFIAVIATVNAENKPEAATIYYIIDNDFSIHFITKTDTSKHKNILNNPNVALVIGTENIPITAQIEGVAQRLTDLHILPSLLERLSTVSNQGEYAAPAFDVSHATMSIFKITITKIKWLDMKGDFSQHIRKEIVFSA